MRIGIDAHTIGSQVGGNETYIKSYIEGLLSINKTNDYFVYHMQKGGIEALFPGSHPRLFFRDLAPKNPLVRVPFSLPLAALRDRLDVLFLQFAAPPLCPCPYVLVVHDLAYEHYPEHFKWLEQKRLKLNTPVSTRRAAHVVTGSEFSRNDIIERYKIKPEKITSIHNGKGSQFKPVEDAEVTRRVRQKYGLPEKYILYVGNIQPRKNLVRLLEAFRALKKEKGIEHQLVVVGKKAWLYSDVFSAIKAEGLESQVVLTGYVPDEDLPALYSAADVFVYPSIFEGFGLPVIEAMACNTAVVTTNTSSLKEIAYDAALLVDPLDVGEITQAVYRVASDERLKRELRAKGLRRAEQFSWKKSAEELLSVFERVHREHRKGRSG